MLHAVRSAITAIAELLVLIVWLVHRRRQEFVSGADNRGAVGVEGRLRAWGCRKRVWMYLELERTQCNVIATQFTFLQYILVTFTFTIKHKASRVYFPLLHS